MKTLIRFNNEYVQFYDYADYKIPEYSRTNVLDLEEIVLSDSFIDDNFNFIFNFIKSKIIKDNISKVFIDKATINKLVFKIIYNIENLNYVYINEDKKIDTELFKYILMNKNIKVFNCYDINPITFERLSLSRKIKIITRKKYTDDSYIYRLNNLNTYSDIYYKDGIVIDKLLQKKDLSKLNEFLKINKYLKIIYIKFFDKKNLSSILKLLEKNKKKNIGIVIIENDTNIKSILNNIIDIKKKNKKYLKKNKIIIKIKYEDKYIKKNIFKELNLNFFKTILIFIILITSIIFGLAYIMNKQKSKETEQTVEKINNIINSIDIEQPKEEKNEPEQPKIESIKTEKPKQKSAYFRSYSKAISELKKINKDTVGWLSLNNSIINYPVVKANNNDKYLNYSFDGKKNINGWIFMDYRNNPIDLDKNTIIYGHSGNYYVMFGSLYKVLEKKWYSNPTNQIITFNTETNNKKWQIFSIYTIDVTSDYLLNEFENDELYMNFLTRLKERSIYDFGQELSPTDHILTLSTCYKDSSKRLVIHAKLLN